MLLHAKMKDISCAPTDR